MPSRAIAGGDKEPRAFTAVPMQIRHASLEEEAAASSSLWRETTSGSSCTCKQVASHRTLLVGSRSCRKSWNLSGSPRTQEELVLRCRLPPGGHVGSGCTVLSAALAVSAAPPPLHGDSA